MANYLINHALNNETSIKTPKQWDSESFKVGEQTRQGAGGG